MVAIPLCESPTRARDIGPHRLPPLTYNTVKQSLSGKFAAITGATSGIGLATARTLIKAGATVVLIGRNEQVLNEVCDGRSALPLVADLSQPEHCEQLADRLLTLVPHIDIFHANAGVYVGGDLINASLEQIDQLLQVNVNAVIKNVRSIMPHMMERKTGDIIITSSLAAHCAVAWEPVYSASKWAINSFVQVMRRQLLPYGIRVGAVSPGPVDTPLVSDGPEGTLKQAKDNGSIIEADLVADAILYMLTRPRCMTIRDMVIIPSRFDL